MNNSCTYIALFRGVNVGGKNRLPMLELKDIFASAGLINIRTYINSGNVLFDYKKIPLDRLTSDLIELLSIHFSFEIKLLIKTKEQLLEIANRVPAEWQNDKDQKCDVLFLWSKYDNPETLNTLKIRAGIDRVRYVPGAIIWSIEKKDINKSGFLKIVGTDTYKQTTIRNVNTVRKLANLLE